MASLLHISADFPDAYGPHKTPAVANLLTLLPEHRHIVYSLNRRQGLGCAIRSEAGETCTAISYRAPPFGVALRPHLAHVAEWIIADVKRRQLRIDGVHGHKLAIEGLIAEQVACALAVPYAVSLWGNTDARYLAMKPGLASAYRRVLCGAAVVTPAAPWIATHIATRLGLKARGWTLLPIVTMADALLHAPVVGPRLVSAFSLDHHRAKGAENLLRALASVRRARHGATSLDIIGGGRPGSRSTVQSLIEREGLGQAVRLVGRVPHDEMQATFSGYAAFVMPTLSETYGMVYVEALLAGLPVVYSAGRGIDGHLDGLDVGSRVDPADVTSIADGITAVLDRQAAMKAEITRLQETGALEKFRRPAIASTYRGIVDALVSGRPPR